MKQESQHDRYFFPRGMYVEQNPLSSCMPAVYRVKDRSAIDKEFVNPVPQTTRLYLSASYLTLSPGILFTADRGTSIAQSISAGYSARCSNSPRCGQIQFSTGESVNRPTIDKSGVDSFVHRRSFDGNLFITPEWNRDSFHEARVVASSPPFPCKGEKRRATDTARNKASVREEIRRCEGRISRG